jgi:hypothetical protein
LFRHPDDGINEFGIITLLHKNGEMVISGDRKILFTFTEDRKAHKNAVITRKQNDVIAFHNFSLFALRGVTGNHNIIEELFK